MWFSLLAAIVLGTIAVLAQEPVSVDDTDTSIVYAPAGAWTVLTNEDADLELYQNSTSYSSVIGATITWKFKGSHVEYWSDIGPNHGRCQITVNGRDNGTVSTFGDFGLPMRHFQRSGLNPESEQTIVITVAGRDDSGLTMGDVCSIDRFVYIPGATASTTSSETSASTPSSDGGGADKSSKSSPPAGVIGGVVGGVVVVILVAAALFFWCRRRRQKNPESIESNIEQLNIASEQGGVRSPIMNENHYTDEAPVSQLGVAAVQATSPSRAPATASREKRTILSAETPTTFGEGSASSATATPSAASRPLVQHLDAGGVAVPEPSGEELPPVYDDQWQRGQHR